MSCPGSRTRGKVAPKDAKALSKLFFEVVADVVQQCDEPGPA
ncbi:hypothetical protein ACFYXH_23640 [Streptomyces sp. NPDC002730]